MKGSNGLWSGPNGAGKTLIADIMQRKFAFKEGEVVFSGDGKVSDFIKSIAFKDIYSLADCRNSYYQTALAFDRDGGDAYYRGIVEGICRF